MLNAGRILKSISPSSYQSSELIAEIDQNLTQDSGNQFGSVAAFLSWLSYSCESEDLLTAEILNQFFQESMDFPHWQQKRATLGEEIRHFLEAICVHQDEVFDFTDVLWPSQMQIIELELMNNWIDAVSSYLTTQYLGQEKFRLIHEEASQKLIAVVLHASGEISVRQFSKKFFVRNGALTPLREDLELHYNSRLELRSDQAQKIETAPFTTARFLVQDQQLFGTVARGYFFQKLHSFSGIDLTSSPKLFYTVRRLEQHFLKRESDPFYQSIVDGTEHCIRMLKIGDDEFIQRAPDVLSQAQNAMEYVFIGDKLLSLLVRDLQYTMAGRSFEINEARPVAGSHKTTAVKQKEEATWPTNPIRDPNRIPTNHSSSRPMQRNQNQSTLRTGMTPTSSRTMNSQNTPSPAQRPRQKIEPDLTN